MSKQRMVNTHFWSDPWVVDELNPLDRYLFLYFLTNDKNNLAGVYEISLRTISNETGLEKDQVIKMLLRLESRVMYLDGWIVLRKAIKHQNYGNSKIKTAIISALYNAPEGVLQYMEMPAELSLPDGWPFALSQPSVSHDSTKDERTLLNHDLSMSHKRVMHAGTHSNINSNSNIKKNSTSANKSLDEVKEIFSYYINCFDASRAHIVLTDKRKTHIRMRLKDAGKDMLMKAILNTSLSAFHRGENERGWKANIDFIIRNYEQVEKLAEMDPVASTDGSGAQKLSQDEIQRAMEKL